MELRAVSDVRIVNVDRGASLLLLDVVEAVVDLDPLDPGGEGRPAFEALEGEKGLEEDLLGEVLGVGRSAGEVATVCEHLAAVAPDELVERSQVTFSRRAGESYELFVSDGVVDVQRCLPECIGPLEWARSHIW